jgi:phytoene desaturase
VYHVQGGLSSISDAMAAVAREYGAQIHTATPVRRVLTRGRRAVGVELQDGDKISCDDVVINADFGHAATTLFEPGQLRRYSQESLRKKNWSCSTFMMYLGLDRAYPEASHHTIVFANDYKRNLNDISHRKIASEDISIYVRNSAVTDPSAAPPGHSALYILVPTPNNFSGIDWTREGPRYRKRILSILAERTPYTDIEQHIQRELIVSPDDWERKLGVYRGATFNLGHNWGQMLFLRPHNQFEEFEHCYLVGGGTHPGSGLPTIFESARISSNLICQQYKIPYSPPRPFKNLGLEPA